MKKFHSLKKRNEFDFVFKNGKSYANRNLVMYVTENNEAYKDAEDYLVRLAGASSVDVINKDLEIAKQVEPLEQLIDRLRTKMKNRHIQRVKANECSIETGFVFNDLLTNYERVADHCSNIAVCVIDAAENNMNVHESLRDMKKGNSYFDEQFAMYKEKYLIAD